MKNKIRETKKPCGILVSTFCFRFINPSMTSFTNLLVRNDYIQPIKSLLVPRLAIFYASLARKT